MTVGFDSNNVMIEVLLSLIELAVNIIIITSDKKQYNQVII